MLACCAFILSSKNLKSQAFIAVLLSGIWTPPNVDAANFTWNGGLNNNDWFTTNNWVPLEFGPPKNFDTATISNGGVANITRNFGAADAVSALVLSGGSDLDVNGYTLDVNGTLSISGLNTDLFIDTGGQIDASQIIITSQAEFRATGNSVLNAFLALGGGDVLLSANRTLTLNQGASVSGGSIDLGSNADFRFQGGTQIVGTANFTIGGGGELHLNGATTFPVPTVGTNTVNLNGAGAVTQNGDVTVYGPTTITGTGTWDLDGDNGGGTVWNVNNDLTLNIARIENSATQQFDGRIDLSGSGTTMTVNIDTAWTMDGRLTVRDGTAMAGTSQMNVTGEIFAQTGDINSPVAFESGASVAVTVGDVLELNGPTFYRGGAYRGGTIQQDGVANVTSTTTLGSNLWAVVSGSPSIPQPPTTYWLEEFDWDGSVGGAAVTNIESGAAFAINAVKIDGNADTDGYDGTLNINGGTLIVNTGDRVAPPLAPLGASGAPGIIPSAWRLDGTMNLQQVNDMNAVVTSQYGSPLQIYGTVNALAGGAAMNGIVVTLKPSGNINVEPGAWLSARLVAEGGTIDVGGLLILSSSSTLHPSVNVTVDQDGVFYLTGATDFQGGIYQGSGKLVQNGNASFTATTNLDVYTEFATGTNAISADREVRFARDALIHPEAEFSGMGSLRNLAGSTLQLLNGANVEVPLTNEGRLTIGSSPGIVMVDEFEQTSTGVLEIEVGGYQAGMDYDQLNVTGAATLDGRLSVPILQLFEINSTHVDFLTTGVGMRTGTFSTVSSPNLTTIFDPDDNIGFDVRYGLSGAYLVFGEVQDNIVLDDDSTMVLWGSSSSWRDVDNIDPQPIPTLLHDITLQNIHSPQSPAAQMVIVKNTNAFAAKLTVGGSGPEDLILKIGDMSAPSTGKLSATKGVLIQEQGVIDLYDDLYEDTIVAPHLKIDGGELRGNGKIDLSGATTSGPGKLSISDGLISPGHLTGKLVVDGDFEQIDEGEILFEIASDIDRDFIDVTGEVVLDGTIIVDTSLGGLMPGQKTTLMSAASIELMSEFYVQAEEPLFIGVVNASEANEVALLGDDRVALLEEDRKVLLADGEIPHDLNRDGVINRDDIPWFAKALKQVEFYQLALCEETGWFPTSAKTDFDNNGITDFDDIDGFAELLRMQPSQVAELIALSLQVPEPSTSFGFLCVCLTAMIRRGRNKAALVEFPR